MAELEQVPSGTNFSSARGRFSYLSQLVTS
jgi:hypothetical protein